jgi:hypothetical protein
LTQRYTPKQLAAVFRKIADGEFRRAQENGLRRGLRWARNEILRELPGRGVLRSVFGRKISGLKKLVSVRRVEFKGDVMVGTVQLTGLAAMSETGGRTKPHGIKPKLRTALTFRVGGRMLFSRVGVKHPGSRIPAIPAAARVVPRATARIRQEQEKSVAAMLAKHGF